MAALHRGRADRLDAKGSEGAGYKGKGQKLGFGGFNQWNASFVYDLSCASQRKKHEPQQEPKAISKVEES